jgi:hypothetical protein
MAITLVQSTLGGWGTATATNVSFGHLNVNTSSAGFGGATTPGNFLVCVSWGVYSNDFTSSITISPPTPTTSGFVWTQLANKNWTTGNPGSYGDVALWYIVNASQMSGTTFCTGQIACNAATDLGAEAEFSLYEFSGIATSSVTDGSGRLASNAVTTSATVPTTLNLTTTGSGNLVINALHSQGGFISAGSGFTIGVSAVHATNGDAQYMTAGAGSIPTSFGASATYWACVAQAFNASTAVAAAAFGYGFPTMII